MKEKKDKSKNETSKKKSAQKKKMKNTTKTLIIAVVTVLVLVGAFFLIKLIPDNSSEDEVSSYIYATEEYTLVSHIPSEIKTIEVKNDFGSFTVQSYTPTVSTEKEDGTTSELTEATVYTLMGYEDMELLLGAPDSLANDAASVTSTKIVDDGSNKSDFGFDTPRATVKTTFTNGDVVTVYLGADAPGELGAYIMIDGVEDVYLVASDAVDSYMFSAMDLLTTDISTTAATEEDAAFTKLVFGGTLFNNEEVVLEHNENTAFSESYVITSPDNTIANEETVTYMVNTIRGITADKVLAIGVEDSKLAEYGLDKPYMTIDAEYPDLKLSYKASEPDENGDFYLMSDGIIYQINKERALWIGYTYEQMIPTSVMSPKLSGVSKITVTTAENTYEFDVKTVIEEDSSSDTTTERTVNKASYNGKDIDEANFNVYYQNLTSAQRTGSTKIDKSQTPVLTVSYQFEDSSTATAVYYAAENRKCPVLINDSFESLAFESYVTKIIADTAAVANGETVTSIY